MYTDEWSLNFKTKWCFNRLGIPHKFAKHLAGSYEETWRDYHGVAHPVGMIRLIESWPMDSRIQFQVILLILGHDWFYKVGRPKGENEEISAQFLSEAIEAGTCSKTEKSELIKLVTQGIRATINHTLDGVDKCFHLPVSILIDADLWGLGSSIKDFKNNNQRIRKEFEPHLTKDEFVGMQILWAEKFLERDRIYLSRYGKGRDEKARENLEQIPKIVRWP